jgi:hypothetical protein
MSSTHFNPAGEVDVQHTGAEVMNEEGSVLWLIEGDVGYCEEEYLSDEEAVAAEEVSSDEESEPSGSSIEEDDVEEEEESSDIEEGVGDEQYAGSDAEDEQAEDEVLSEEDCYLGSDDEVQSALASEYSEQHEGSQSIEGGEHIVGYVHNATAAHTNHGDQVFDINQVAVQRETSSYIENGNVDYSNSNGSNYEHHGGYTYPQYTTYAEAITYEEAVVKKPGMMRRFTDKAKANMKDEEKRRKALHVIQTGAQFTRFGRVVTEFQTSGPEIMHARANGKKAVGKKVAKLAVKAAAKALL